MIPLLTAQQLAFFSQNRYLELEGLLTKEACTQYLESIQSVLQQRGARDLWRDVPTLKSLILSRKCTSIAQSVCGQNSLRVACDQWFEPLFQFDHPSKIKDLLSIQGVEVVFLIALSPPPEHRTFTLGLFPFPRAVGNALLVHPDLLLNWPPQDSGLYMIAYAKANSIFIHNPKDSYSSMMRQFGYGFGDLLTNQTHPRVPTHH